MMIVIGCSNGAVAKDIAKKLKARYSALYADKFPDDEIRVRLQTDVKGKEIILVQTFSKHISDSLLEVILAASTAKELGAKKVHLVAPYFPYLRQDKRFNEGEAISQYIIAGLIDRCCDSVTIIDPHLHRVHSLSGIFKIKTNKLTANSLIASYIKKHVKNPIVIGPDEESFKWAKSVADSIGAQSRILKKTRYDSFHVKVKLNDPISLKDKTAVIVDDIVSTGHTILEAAKMLKKLGAKKVICICVHGIFVNDALSKFKKAGIEVVSTNAIPNPAAKIDVSGLIADSFEIKKKQS